MGGGLQHFSIGPKALWSLNFLGLGWGWGTKGFWPGLDNFQFSSGSSSFSVMSGLVWLHKIQLWHTIEKLEKNIHVFFTFFSSFRTVFNIGP